jgi:hypothetical protein
MTCHVTAHMMRRPAFVSCHVLSCHDMTCRDTASFRTSSYLVMPCHCPHNAASCHILSCHFTHNAASCHILSCHVTAHIMWRPGFVSCHVMSCYDMTCRDSGSFRISSYLVMPCHCGHNAASCFHVLLCQVISLHTKCRVLSYLVMSCHVTRNAVSRHTFSCCVISLDT